MADASSLFSQSNEKRLNVDVCWVSSNVPFASAFLRGLRFTVFPNLCFWALSWGQRRVHTVPPALSLQYLFYPTLRISLLMYVYLFNISDQLVEVFLAATWEQMERNHMDPGWQYKGSKILEVEDQGKGDRRPRTGYDFYRRSHNHFLRGKERSIGLVLFGSFICAAAACPWWGKKKFVFVNFLEVNEKLYIPRRCPSLFTSFSCKSTYCILWFLHPWRCCNP